MSDTLWTHEPPKEPGWYWRIYRRSPRAEHTPEWTPPVAILVTERRDGLYVDEWRIHADGAFRWCHTPIPPPPLADAPVLSPSETEDEERAAVSTKNPFLPDGVYYQDGDASAKLPLPGQGWISFAAAVEAAYREGFDAGEAQGYSNGDAQEVGQAWCASEAKKKLEGMK